MSVNIFYSSESYTDKYSLEFNFYHFEPFTFILRGRAYVFYGISYCGKNSYNSSRRLNMLNSYNKFSEK